MATRTVTLSLNGGGRMLKFLENIKHRLGNGAVVSVGFIDKRTYPQKPRRARKGKANTKKLALANAKRRSAPPLFVAQVAAWNEFGTATQQARPFFRNMIKASAPKWPEQMAAIAKRLNYDSKATLGTMGEGIKGQLVQSINELRTPKNKDSTIARKGFDKPLIDTSVMVNSVDYQVKGA